MAKISYKKNINIGRVVAKTVGIVLGLYVGGQILNEIGNVLNCTASPYYKGLALIGWTVSDNIVPNTAGAAFCNGTTAYAGSTTTVSGLITSVSGSGLLTVIGIVGIASIVMEFVEFKL